MPNRKMKGSNSRYTSVLILSLLYSLTVAVVPPHPDSEFDSSFPLFADDSRRQLRTEHQYETQLLHPGLCRFEDYHTCQALDESLQRQAHRTLASTKTRGRLKVLVVLLRFANHNTREVIEASDIDKFFNANGVDSTLYPTGSINTYVKVSSFQSLTIDADVISWFPTDKTEQECAGGTAGLKQDFQSCFAPILDSLDGFHANPEHVFNWDKYDEDRDGMVDSLVVMHSGYGAEYGNADPLGAASKDRIWSHSMGPPEKDLWNSVHAQYSVGTYTVASAFHGHEGKQITKVGVVLHELLHTLSLPHLYDVSRSDRGGGAGAYSIMSNPWGQGGDGSFPGSLDPWSKIQLGWLTPTRIIKSGPYVLKPSATENQVYLIDDPYPRGEYLLIENRQKTLYDGKMWDGAGGALIWHVDESKSSNSEAGGPYQENWPENGKHYKVALLQADGSYHLEQNANDGQWDDFFTFGRKLGPGSAGVYPNTDSYQGGNILRNDITISDFEEEGRNVKFTVSGYPQIGVSNNPITGIPKCAVNVNIGQCSSYLTSDIPLIESDCDCYNFCGSDMIEGCCKFGEPCPITCESGGLVAGCTLAVEKPSDPDVDLDDVANLGTPAENRTNDESLRSGAYYLRWRNLFAAPVLLLLGSLALNA
ncbi:MAG: hypothetical protein SGBAC_005998 [Bacillariaceae sp.]